MGGNHHSTDSSQRTNEQTRKQPTGPSTSPTRGGLLSFDTHGGALRGARHSKGASKPLPNSRFDKPSSAPTNRRPYGAASMTTNVTGDVEPASKGTIHAAATTLSTAAQEQASAPSKPGTRILTVEGFAEVTLFENAAQWKAKLAYDDLDPSQAIQLTDYRYDGNCDTVILDHDGSETTGYLVSAGTGEFYRLPAPDTRTFVIDGNVKTLMLNMKPGKLRVPVTNGGLAHLWINEQNVLVKHKTAGQHMTDDGCGIPRSDADTPPGSSSLRPSSICTA